MPSVLFHLSDHSKTYIFLCRSSLDGKAWHLHNWKMYDLIAWVGSRSIGAQCNCEHLATEQTAITGTKHMSAKSLWFWCCKSLRIKNHLSFLATCVEHIKCSGATIYSSALFFSSSSFAVIHTEEMPLLPKPNLDGSPSSRYAIAVRDSNLSHQIEVFRTFRIRWTRAKTLAWVRSPYCDTGCHTSPKTNANIKGPRPKGTI